VLAASAAGWALLGAGLVVIEGMDMRDGRWFTAAGWLGAIASGAYLGVVPGYTREPVHWSLVLTVFSAATVCWQNIDAICAEAKQRASRPVLAPVIGLGLLAGCVAVAPALALEQTAGGRVFVLNDAEVALCEEHGGCAVATNRALRELQRKAGKCGPTT
jgi:hypothetical protein